LGSSGSTYIVSQSGEYTRLSETLGSPSTYFDLAEGTIIQLGKTRIQVKTMEIKPGAVSQETKEEGSNSIVFSPTDANRMLEKLYIILWCLSLTFCVGTNP
jgi:hypothetical protein